MRTFLLVILGIVLGFGGLLILLVGFIEFCQLADAWKFPRAAAYLLTVLLAAALGFICDVFQAWGQRFAERHSGKKMPSNS